MLYGDTEIKIYNIFVPNKFYYDKFKNKCKQTA
jgi:hypothetical protein